MRSGSQYSGCGMAHLKCGLKVISDIGPTEIVQHSAYRGSSHLRKGATSHIINRVWLYRSPYPRGEKGGYFTCSATEQYCKGTLEMVMDAITLKCVLYERRK